MTEGIFLGIVLPIVPNRLFREIAAGS